MNWFFYQYEVTFFILGSIICSEIYFEINLATPAFFLVYVLAWYVFHSLLYNLFVSFNLKCISYRKHIFGSCFFINSSSLYFLIGAFMPFIFSVIIGTIRFKSITFKSVYKYHFDSSFLLNLYVLLYSLWIN